MRLLCSVVLALLLVALPRAPASEKDIPALGSKELIDEARNFLKTARSALNKLQDAPENFAKTIYMAGAKDGALGTAVALIGLYLVVLHTRKP